MATMYGLVGGLSGKMGNAVFKQRRGVQIVSQYQPKVLNPNTESQQAARAKFKLITQLAAIMKPAFGGTMSVLSRPERGSSPQNHFTKKNYELISTDSTSATIDMSNLQLTDSFRQFPVPSSRIDMSNLTVDIEGITADVTNVRFVLVGYKTIRLQESTVLQAYVAQIVDVQPDSGLAKHTFSELESGNYTVLTYGQIPTSADGELALSNIFTPVSGREYVSRVTFASLVQAGDMTETITTGINAEL